MKKKYLSLVWLVFLTVTSYAQPCTELFISEYVEGSGNNKFIEIYNPTSSNILLTGSYDIQIFFNGSGTAGSTIGLVGTILANDVFVLENPGESLGVSEDQQSGSLSFNGDDAIVLRNGATILDVIGQIGFDPGAQWVGAVCTEGTGEGTMVRNAAIESGDNNGADVFDPDIEWVCFPQNTITDLGSHTNTCVATNEIQLQLPIGTDIACGFNADFGTQNIGTDTDFVLRVQNTGAADLNVSAIALASGVDFSLIGVPALPFVITGGNSQDITIRFSPSSLGVFNDTLTITSDDSNEGTCVVNLEGTGSSLCSVTTTVIAAQDFESAGSDTWNYTPDHAPIANFWYVTNSLTNIPTAQSATNFWGITDLDRAGHTGIMHDITFDTVDVSAFNNVELSFYYYTVDLDGTDNLEYELFYDGISQGLVDISPNTSAWTQVIVNIPDAVTMVQIIFYADLDAANDQAGLDNFVISSTSLNTTTWDGLSWDNGFPDNTLTAIIDGNFNTATDAPGSFDACSLIVNADLTISGTDYIQITNDVTIDGTILITTEANLLQVNDASAVTLNGAGTGIVQKTTTPLQAYYSYTYWSSPFVNEIIGEAGSGMDLVPSNRIFQYDAANFEDISPVDGFDDNSDDWAIASGPMVPGRGYAAFAQNNGLAFPQTQTFSFDGEFNNGIVTIPITVSAGAGDPNWNFLGNPYPSGINADDFILNNTDLDGTIYLWTHNSTPLDTNPGPDELNFSVDDYASYTPGTGGVAAVSGGTVPTNVIASGQGFFVDALNAGTATFDNSLRVTTGNDNFFRATDRAWLSMENNDGAFSQILIGFAEGATNGIDRLYDGKRLEAGSYISFFSIIEDEHYAIQGREPLIEEEVIPLGIKNLVPGNSEYKILLNNVEGLLETTEIVLIDNLLNITHDLNSGPYVFIVQEGIFKERFDLSLKPAALSVSLTEDLVELNIIKNQDNTLTFNVTDDLGIKNIKIFDVLGRKFYDLDFNTLNNDITLKLNQIDQTIFVAKVTLQDGKVLNKKVLK